MQNFEYYPDWKLLNGWSKFKHCWNLFEWQEHTDSVMSLSRAFLIFTLKL